MYIYVYGECMMSALFFPRKTFSYAECVCGNPFSDVDLNHRDEKHKTKTSSTSCHKINKQTQSRALSAGHVRGKGRVGGVLAVAAEILSLIFKSSLYLHRAKTA